MPANGSLESKTEIPLDGLIRRSEALWLRTKRMDRMADDLIVLTAGLNNVAAPVPDAAVEPPDAAWDAAGIPALTIGVRELLIFSALLALGVAAAFFLGYVASHQIPGVFE